jgi:hypothetical protein
MDASAAARAADDALALLTFLVSPALGIHRVLPFGPQNIHTSWNRDVEHLGIGYALGPKIPKPLAHFTPCRDDATAVPVAQQDWPDHSLCLVARIV